MMSVSAHDRISGSPQMAATIIFNAGTNCGSCIPEVKKLLVSSGSEFPAAA
jgi:NAD(P)H-nitrite reductase large subunit